MRIANVRMDFDTELTNRPIFLWLSIMNENLDKKLKRLLENHSSFVFERAPGNRP